jgi:hypothetical protein
LLRELHIESQVDFVNAKGFGDVQAREHVAGFQGHAFRTMPKLESGGERPQRWTLQKLELVSLLKHEQPAVYLSEHLPRMDELREAKTRPPSSFESAALADLQSGEDLKVQTTANRLRMLGSIRAVEQCLQCHQVKRGDLLGAFSYQFRNDAQQR